MPLQLSAGNARCAGQDGYPSMQVPRTALKALRGLFAANDKHGKETMVHLFGVRVTAGSRCLVLKLTDILLVEQRGTETACAMTDMGSQQFAKFSTKCQIGRCSAGRTRTIRYLLSHRDANPAKAILTPSTPCKLRSRPAVTSCSS